MLHVSDDSCLVLSEGKSVQQMVDQALQPVPNVGGESLDRINLHALSTEKILYNQLN